MLLEFCLSARPLESPIPAPPTQSVTLAWTASSDPSVVGYYLYSWANGLYSGKIDVGTNTSFTIGGLIAWQTNYFVLTSYNPYRSEGPPSTGKTYIAPG